MPDDPLFWKRDAPGCGVCCIGPCSEYPHSDLDIRIDGECSGGVPSSGDLPILSPFGDLTTWDDAEIRGAAALYETFIQQYNLVFTGTVGSSHRWFSGYAGSNRYEEKACTEKAVGDAECGSYFDPYLPGTVPTYVLSEGHGWPNAGDIYYPLEAYECNCRLFGAGLDTYAVEPFAASDGILSEYRQGQIADWELPAFNYVLIYVAECTDYIAIDENCFSVGFWLPYDPPGPGSCSSKQYITNLELSPGTIKFCEGVSAISASCQGDEFTITLDAAFEFYYIQNQVVCEKNQYGYSGKFANGGVGGCEFWESEAELLSETGCEASEETYQAPCGPTGEVVSKQYVIGSEFPLHMEMIFKGEQEGGVFYLHPLGGMQDANGWVSASDGYVRETIEDDRVVAREYIKPVSSFGFSLSSSVDRYIGPNPATGAEIADGDNYEVFAQNKRSYLYSKISNPRAVVSIP